MERTRMIARLRPGTNRCQCGACGETFGSVGTFDRHRAGQHGVERRCLTSFEMRRRGLRQIPGGWWVRGRMPSDYWQGMRGRGDRHWTQGAVGGAT